MTDKNEISDFWQDFPNILEKHGKEIAVMIAEWWHSQKIKHSKDEVTTYEQYVKGNYLEDTNLLDSTIIIEHVMKVESISPLRLEKDYSQIIIKRQDGKKCIVRKFMEMGSRQEKEMVEIPGPPLEMQVNHCCSTCDYELYWQDGIDKDVMGIEILFNRRDCLCQNSEAQQFFKNNTKITLSKGDIKPVINCPFWKQKNGI